MSKITRIPKHIISQIAAGEVVERPVNIVKELVENSLDAEADKIIIQIEKGGLEMVQVSDNGYGITADQLEMAFELHTTSKLGDKNVFEVETLGFRGEALGSIASVSRVECRSRSRNSNSGYMIELEGGKLLSKSNVNMDEGTTTKISGIFYNTPARRKFLKSSNTERRHVMKLITHYALLYPKIHFILNERDTSGRVDTKIESPPRQSILAAVFDVLGHEIASELREIRATAGNWKITGFISESKLIRKDRNLQFININGRPIQHTELQGLIEKAYGSRLMRSSHPVLILSIDGPVDEVDFNVHPRKAEVRFKTDDPIFDEIFNIVDKTLSEIDELPQLIPRKIEHVGKKYTTPKSGTPISSRIPKRTQIQTTFDMTSSTGEISSKPVVKNKEEPIESKDEIFRTLIQSDSSVIIDGNKKVLGHVMQKFGLIDAGSELWLVDIHAADERVKFEIYEERRSRKILSQQMLTPLEINIAPVERQIIVDNIEQIKKFGMIISEGTSKSVLVHAFPVLYDREINSKTITELLTQISNSISEQQTEFQIKTAFNELEYKIVANLSCHGSIRSGYHVSNEKIGEVVSNLLKCKNMHTCAHGRPTILRIGINDLESWFKR